MLMSNENPGTHGTKGTLKARDEDATGWRDMINSVMNSDKTVKDSFIISTTDTSEKFSSNVVNTWVNKMHWNTATRQ